MATTDDIIQKVKEALDIVDEISDVKLLDELKKCIARNHPDRFTDEDLIKQAEEECKNLNVLYGELKKYIEHKRLADKSLATYNQEEIIRLDFINESDVKDK